MLVLLCLEPIFCGPWWPAPEVHGQPVWRILLLVVAIRHWVQEIYPPAGKMQEYCLAAVEDLSQLRWRLLHVRNFVVSPHI